MNKMNDLQEYNSESIDPEIFWSEFQNITSVLESDLDEIQSQLTTNDSQFWRRTFCRAFFAYLEGQTHALKQLFLFYDWWTVDPDTEHKIRNQKHIQNKDGSTKVIQNYLPLVQNVQLLFKALAVSANIEPIISNNDKSWDLLSKAVNVRNRIVHPKKSEDLIISDDEIQLIRYVGGWYLSNASELLTKRAQLDIKKIKAMDKTAREKFGSSIQLPELDLLLDKFKEEDEQ